MSSSSLESAVAKWLDDRGIRYEREVRVWFRRVDFVLEDHTIVQVHGCFIHGCEDCCRGKKLWTHQRTARRRDKAFRTYCQGKKRRLFEIWEHDIIYGEDRVLVEATAQIRKQRPWAFR